MVYLGFWTAHREHAMIDLLEEHRAAIAALCEEFKVRRLEVFGSATDSERFDHRHSDLDFLVEFKPEAEPSLAALYLDLVAALRDLLGREVDLVMDRAVRNPVLRETIDRDRTMLYAA